MIKFITSFHLDFYVDASFGAAMDHIHRKFLKTEEKLIQISNMDIHAVKWYFVLTNVASSLAICVYTWFSQSLKSFKESSCLEYLIDRALLFFPIHTLSIRMTIKKIKHIGKQRELKDIIKKVMIEENSEDRKKIKRSTHQKT